MEGEGNAWEKQKKLQVTLRKETRELSREEEIEQEPGQPYEKRKGQEYRESDQGAQRPKHGHVAHPAGQKGNYVGKHRLGRRHACWIHVQERGGGSRTPGPAPWGGERSAPRHAPSGPGPFATFCCPAPPRPAHGSCLPLQRPLGMDQSWGWGPEDRQG